MEIEISLNDQIEETEVIEIYSANKWSSAEKPEQLLSALRNSDTLVTARFEGKLVGIANAISDGFLVVYYPHMLVHPEYQRKSIGSKMMGVMKLKYSGYHQQMLTAESGSVQFYESLGFEKAGDTSSMWIYSGNEH